MDNFDALDTSSTIPATPNASTPAPVNETPPDVNPFADDKGVQTLSQGTTPLLERMRLHFKQAQVKETPFGAASHFGDTFVERAARARGNPSDLENESIDRAVKNRDDLAGYDRMPGAEGFLEYGAAIVGHLAGNVADPTSAIGNVVKIPYLAGKGFVSALGRFGVGEGAALTAGRMAEFGVNQAIINTATDPVVQGINIATGDGTRDSYDAFQTFVESPIGGFVGGAVLKGAHEAGSALFIRPQVEKDALFFLRMLRDQADEESRKRWPEMAEAVKDKTDRQLGDMAKEIASDDKAAGNKAGDKTAGDKANEPAKPPLPDNAAPETPPFGNDLVVGDRPATPETPTPRDDLADGYQPPVTPEPGFVTTPIDDANLIGARAPRMPAHRVATADGKKIDVAPVIVEAADLKASNDPGFDPALQPRNRDRAASQGQIADIATRLDPERLGHSAEADRGAPIVGPDGMVESGNGRIMAIREAYKQNDDAAKRYRDWLTSQGVDVSQYKEPVLVRQRLTEMTPDERRAFTDISSVGTTLSMSAPERALSDARNISVNDLDLIEVPNDLGAAGNLGFVRAFISKLPQTEQGALMDEKGRLSQEGLIRVRNAVLARAYGDSHILLRIAESIDDDIKSISNALTASAPYWARLRSDVEAGRVRADMDITPELIEAVTRTAELRGSGQKLDTFLAQSDALNPLDENVEWLMKLFYSQSGRRASSAQDMAKNLKYYTEEAFKVQADGGLDLGMTPVLPRDILRTAAEKGFANERAKGQKAGDLFGGGAGDGARGQTGSGGPGRPADGGGRDGVREPGAGSDQGRQQRVGTETGEAGSGVRWNEVTSPDQIDGRPVALGEMYRGTEGGNVDATLRVTVDGDLGDGIYFTHLQKLAASYGGGPTSKISDGSRVVHTFNIDQPLAPHEVAYAFGLDAGKVKIVSGAGEVIFEGKWNAGRGKNQTLMETALRGTDVKVVIGAKGGFLHNQVSIRDPSILADRRVGMDVSTPDYRASRAMENALDNIEAAVESGDRKAVAAAAKEAKKVLADTPQSVKDLEPEYWGQFEASIKQMSRKGYVTGKQQFEADALQERNDKMPGIGDSLAAHAESGGEAPLDVAMRPMQFSDRRVPEAQHVPSPTPVEAPNIRRLWADIARDLGATVRAGRVQGKTAAGQYFLRSGVIRMRQFDDPVVLIHEIGHHVEDKYGKPLQDIIFSRANASIFGGMELDNMTYYAQSHKNPLIRRKEGFAEFFRLLIENPSEAQNRAPNFLKDFDRFMSEQPELRATIQKAQGAFDAYRLANAEDIVDANIHSATETKGWAKVREDVRNDGFWNTITERGSRVYTGLFDANNTLAVTVRNLLQTQKDNTGKIISLIAADDAYKLIRLASHAHQAGMIDLMHGVTPYKSNAPEGPSIFDAIALATGKPNIASGWDESAVKSFSGYLVALRGVFEWERRAAGLLTKDPMPLPKDMFETKIRVYEKRNPNARAAADMVHEWTRNLLKKEYEAGLITADAYDAALQIRDYVPLLRDMSDKSNVGQGREFDAENVGLKRFKGSARPIVDPIQSLMERSFRSAQLIAHNDAIQALGRLADKAGPGGGQWVERIPSHEIKAQYVDPLEALRKGLQDNGVPKSDADLAISQMLSDLRIDEKDMGPVAIFRSKLAAERGENIVFYLSGGEMKALRLKEGEFGRELIMNLTGGLSAQLRDWNLTAMGQLSSALRFGVVTSPDFFISNMIRDQLATFILNRGTLPLFDSFRGIYREVTKSELSRTFAQTGGIAGGANLNAIDKARMDKDIQALAAKGFTVARFANWEGVFKAIELSETASRVGLFEVSYKRALKQGLSPYEASIEAAFQANDNLDFSRVGSRLANTAKLIPFLNANMQGIDKAIRTLFAPAFMEKLTKQDVEAQKTMYSAWAKIAGLTGLSMALRANYIDDPEYQELSPYMRNMNWMVRVPGMKGNKVVDMFGNTVEVPEGGLQSLWLAIPKPFELAIPFNLGERAVEMLYQKNPKAFSQWAWGALDLVAGKTMMSSVGIKVTAEMISGKDFFTKRDIVPEHLQGLEPWAQATAGTSTLATAIGAASDRVNRATGLGPEGGLSPMYVDQLIKGVGGTQARNLLSLTDAAVGTKGDQSLADTAIARRWWKESYRGSTSVTEFWDQVGDKTGGLAQAANTYASMLSNPAAAEAYVARLPPDKRAFVIMTKSEFPGEEKNLHPLINAHHAMTALSNMKRDIANQGLQSAATLDPIQLTPSEQRVALDALSRIQMWTARNALIASGAAALKGQNPKAIDADMEALQATVPAVYDELSQRYANAKVYKAEAVADHWNDVRDAVIGDGSEAQLRSIASEVRRDGFELDGRKDKKKKVRPVIPGAPLEAVN